MYVVTYPTMYGKKWNPDSLFYKGRSQIDLMFFTETPNLFHSLTILLFYFRKLRDSVWQVN